MRRPAVGIAFLLGPLLAFTGATALPACQTSTSETTDAGTDVYIPPTECDTVGYTCAQCQACSGTQTTCGTQLQSCANDDGCTSLAQTIDGTCNVGAETEISDCVTAACNYFSAEQDSITIYDLAAACVFQNACKQTCTLQATFDYCPQ